MSISVGEPSKPYTITVVAGQHKQPVPNALVQVRIDIVNPGAKGVHFAKKNQPNDKTLMEIRIRTNDKGQASIGAGAEWYILSATEGPVSVHFDVIEPASSKAVLELTPSVSHNT